MGTIVYVNFSVLKTYPKKVASGVKECGTYGSIVTKLSTLTGMPPTEWGIIKHGHDVAVEQCLQACMEPQKVQKYSPP